MIRVWLPGGRGRAGSGAKVPLRSSPGREREEGEEPERGRGDEDKTSGWLGLTSCPLGDSPDDPSAAILSSFIGYSFKGRLRRQAGGGA